MFELRSAAAALGVLVLGGLGAAPAAAITFRDIAASAGITYQRVPSLNNAVFDAIKERTRPGVGTYSFLGDFPGDTDTFAETPYKSRGLPGVAIFDYDNDGDLDLYVSNGPGAANSLYQNRLVQTGAATFVDVGAAAGVAATDMDSNGVTAGDIDNDGDMDLLVLGNSEPNRLFENLGNGTFRDISAASGLGGSTFMHSSASMGDVNNDGLLDVYVANTFSRENHHPIITQPLFLNQPDQLYLNLGGNRFQDVSATSGIQNLDAVPPGAATISWSVALVDIDQDGDVDIVHPDDEASFGAGQQTGPFFQGWIHILRNDGTGHFTDVTSQLGTNKVAAWKGLSFADFNADGRMDFFFANRGDYLATFLAPELPLGTEASRWFLQNPNGTFADPGVGELIATPWGWSTSTLDYDNDGDTDIVYFGAHDTIYTNIEASNPGVLLRNENGTARFTYDAAALSNPGSADHQRRNIEGAAVGDLNNDGFVDIVTASSHDYPAPYPLVRYADLGLAFGSPFDAVAAFIPQFTLLGPPQGNPPLPADSVWNGFVFPNGTLSVEMNSADSGNGWVEITLVGAKGTTTNGRVNRSAFGAVARFTPDGGKSAMRPIIGGSSYLSEDSPRANFGLGSAAKGTLEILWPGGVRSRLYNVRASERLVVPELSVSYDVRAMSLTQYVQGVTRDLNQLTTAGVINAAYSRRLLTSALQAYVDYRSAPPR